ncbi:MAG TPA: M48 family metallopeptidase, partial [Hymenobacter sp.]
MLALDASLYTPSPAAVPEGLTRPSSRYVLLVAAMLVSIALFIGLYLVLLAGAVGLVYLTLTLHFDRYGLWTFLFHLGCLAGSLMLVAFLVKALFKRRPVSELHQHPRLTPTTHPALFDFVHRLCAEVGADHPKYISVSSDVNAAVFYDNSTRSLFWPTRKNLLIGLGLVNGLNLSEFKAVLAHEFGHFAQRSMRLGSYVNTASRLLHDMVYERDKWDELLVQWRTLDIRVSAAAWL